MGERLVRNEEVSGSNPLISTRSHASRAVSAFREADPSALPHDRAGAMRGQANRCLPALLRGDDRAPAVSGVDSSGDGSRFTADGHEKGPGPAQRQLANPVRTGR